MGISTTAALGPSPCTLPCRYWTWALLPETLPLSLQTAARQHSAGLLLGTIIFISQSRVCALIGGAVPPPWQQERLRKCISGIFRVRSESLALPHKAADSCVKEVHRLERQKESTASAYEDLLLPSGGNESWYGFCM